MKRHSLKALREKREAGGWTLAEVALLLGRTRAWLCNIELGNRSTDNETLARINEVIDRLNAIRESTRGSKNLTDLRLPRARNRRS